MKKLEVSWSVEYLKGFSGTFVQFSIGLQNMKKLEVLWFVEYLKGFSAKNMPKGVVRKLEDFQIDFQLPTLLSGFKEEHATVYVRYKFKPNPFPDAKEGILINNYLKKIHPRTELNCSQKVFGKSGEVYAFVLDNMNTGARDLFISSWNIAKNRKYKAMIGVPFPQAKTNEKLLEKVTEHGMTPKRFAQKLNKDYSNLFRELKGQKQFSLQQALDYAKALDCDPVELLFEKTRCDVWGYVDLYNSNELGNETFNPCQIYPAANVTNNIGSVVVPRDIYTPNIKAIRISCEGSHMDRHYAFYRKTDVAKSSMNGKLVVVGKEDPRLEEFGYEPTSYWFGIYDIAKGGVQTIYNPDRFAKTEKAVKGPFTFVAEVISVMSENALTKRSQEYYEMNAKAKQFFAIHEKQRQQLELSMMKLRDSMAKSEDMLHKITRASIEADKKELKKKLKLFDDDIEVPDFIKKRA